MKEKTLSIFVDESGRFRHPDNDSRFYIISLVLHDQSVDISAALSGLDLRFADLVCTIRFIDEKIRAGGRMTPSEFKFFGGPKEFRHNILRTIKSKEI